jgi:acylphosphatase
MTDQAKKIIFSGSVQGIGFRYTVSRISVRYSLTGYVKNLADGTVEVFAQGKLSEIDLFIEDIKESFAGYIRGCKESNESCNTSFADFRIAF